MLAIQPAAMDDLDDLFAGPSQPFAARPPGFWRVRLDESAMPKRNAVPTLGQLTREPSMKAEFLTAKALTVFCRSGLPQLRWLDLLSQLSLAR
jgi:hypothetical protein